jgi:xanthine dehydrogenase accessory factor
MTTFAHIVEAIHAEGAAALVRVAATEGSAPREPGARMIVRPSGAFNGTIGGGALEWAAIAEARRLLAQGRGPLAVLTQSLGPDLAQCCGGRVRILIETFDARDRGDLSALAAREARGPLVTVARRDVEGRLQRRAVWPDEEVPVTADREVWETHRVPVLIFGAGHVGRALVLALAPLPFAVRWIDSRENAFPAAVPANVTMVRNADPAAEAEAAPAAARLVVMTHSHPLDLDIVARALASAQPFPYIGLIGSATKRARFVSRLRGAGLADSAIGRLVCPIGIPGIGGKEPAVIAASTAAQLLALSEAQSHDP